ncbi:MULTISPECIES: ABC transporter ATP-binding protein [Dehalococcoides]|jgi:iron complex transport system ATP-binding protein|uniref:ABC transporter ATP-binding protein n=3 Tax=Dehalococcoides mccartyi TaxID=61435 RepID=A0A142VA98_9CHLR|nr:MULTISPECIES: ATP-binding cassette domain-containing protein [Dehalococcoides]AGG06398.1 putative ATP-binding protein [Dehalococcoides mccartyi DCMB5]AGG07829.1 putative ATP-binding protein [Dehalococcoides mccartyi BTF08]AII60908.1 cobalt ABC transporter [Dehalococcoides mccartyi CG5]AMU86531.1 ABC transporter ATP-binding protein [Dehalococcoides mccartyi]AOV99356.1 ABC transporter, ATP-binding protein [Dehalococcoides mccartyi]
MTNRDLPPLIEFKNISLMRGERLCLKNINLVINQRQSLAILGPNGAGKSSLIKTITRELYPIFDPLGSSLRILGRGNWDVFELRSQLGIVSAEVLRQDISQTCQEAVLSGYFGSPYLRDAGLISPKMKTYAQDMMNLLEIDHLAERLTDEISSGEARRVVIARALVNNPQSLLLDEPTTNLDMKSAHQLRQLLSKISNLGTQIILVTHNLTDIIPEINRVVMLKDGSIFRDGAKIEIMTETNFSELFGFEVNLLNKAGFYYLY